MAYFSSPNRTLCDVLEDMRRCHKTLNFALLSSLIEEVQTIGNRMESALWDQKDFESADKLFKQLKVKIKKMESKLEEE